MKKNEFLFLSLTLLLSVSILAQDLCKPFGWANCDGQSYKGDLTGGGNANPIEVTTFAALKSAAESSDPKVIYIKNSVGDGYKGTSGDVLYVKSDKTIIGYPGVTVKCSWQIKNVSNIIIRNLKLQGPGNSNSEQNWDVVAINGSKGIWVDHCIVIDGEDGNFDVSKGSDDVTASWCIFTYSADGPHNFSNLIGSSDNEPISHDKLNVTFANCWWKNVGSRTPRTRYGKIHILNCYYSNSPGPTVGFMSTIRVEACYFDKVTTPIGIISDGGKAGIFPIDCEFVGCSGNTNEISKGGYTLFTPPYSYTKIPAANVKSLVTNSTCGAGPTIPSPTTCCGSVSIPVTGVSVAPTSTSLNVDATTQLNATVAPSNASNKNVNWSSNNTSIATVSSSGLVKGVMEGTATIIAKTEDGNLTAIATIIVKATNGECSWIEYQAEVGTLSAGSMDNNNSGFTGTGFANTANSINVWYEIMINVPSAGTHSIRVRYADGGSVDRTQSIKVNSITQISSLSFPTTGSWTTWNTVQFSLNLNAGNNTIRFTSLTSSGAANIDRIDVCQGGTTTIPVTGVNVTPTSATITSTGGTVALTATVTPSNATNKSITWSSGNTAAATVSSSGVVTAIANGDAIITVTTVDGSYTATSAIKVEVGSNPEPCDNPVSISIPFAKDGAGEFCYAASQEIAYVNSWNMDLVEINGVDFTNKWSNSLPAAIDGKWYIHYKASVAWAHFEAPAAKGAEEHSAASNEVSIYPNPFTKSISIRIANTDAVNSIYVMDAVGRVISTLEKAEITSEMNIGGDFKSGIYFLRVQTSSGVKSYIINKY